MFDFLKAFKLFLFIILTILTTVTHSKSADIYKKLLDHNIVLQNQGDLIFSAKMYKYISDSCNDNEIKAEALYRLADIGSKFADVLNMRDGLYYDFSFNLRQADPEYKPKREHIRNIWDKNFNNIIKQDIDFFRTLGLQIELVHFFESYYICKPNLYQKIAEQFPNTEWGESANYYLILNGDIFLNDPHNVVKNVNVFLDKYPNSRYKYDAFCILAKANADLWSFSQYPDYIDNLTEDELQNVDNYRIKAIELFEEVVKNKDKLLEQKIDFGGVPNLLKAKKKYDVFYYFGD